MPKPKPVLANSTRLVLRISTDTCKPWRPRILAPNWITSKDAHKPEVSPTNHGETCQNNATTLIRTNACVPFRTYLTALFRPYANWPNEFSLLSDHERIPEEHRRIVLAVQSKMPVPEDIRSRRPALAFLNETRFGKDRLEILEVREPCVWPH